MKHAFVVDIAADPRCMRDLEVGGVYIAGATVKFDDVCHLVLRAGNEELTVAARAVLVTEDGVGLQIEALTTETRARIAALVEIAKYVDLERKQTLDKIRRAPASSIAPNPRARVANGSISPITAYAPTQEGEHLADKARTAKNAADDDDESDD